MLVWAQAGNAWVNKYELSTGWNTRAKLFTMSNYSLAIDMDDAGNAVVLNNINGNVRTYRFVSGSDWNSLDLVTTESIDHLNNSGWSADNPNVVIDQKGNAMAAWQRRLDSPINVHPRFNRFQYYVPKAELSVSIDAAVSDGANLTINYTVQNKGSANVDTVAVDFFVSSAAVPTMGTVGDSTATLSNLSANSSSTGVLQIPTSKAYGIAYMIVDTANIVPEFSELNNVSAGIAWEGPVVAPVTFSFEDGLLPSAFKTAGAVGWQIAADTTGNGLYNLRSGLIGNGEFTCSVITVNNVSSVSFDYLVNAESLDELRFYVDDLTTPVHSILGDTTAILYTNFTKSIPLGPHIIQWCYVKDASGSLGSDSAIVDNIQFN